MDRESRFQALLRFAVDEPLVLALYVFGSRGRSDGLSDEHSDYDVGVVLRDTPGVGEKFDRLWPFTHGSSVEISRTTLSELRDLGEYGSPTEWSRPLYAVVDLRLDKTGGEVASILASKRTVPLEVQPALIRRSLDAYINATYRSLRYRMVGACEGARLDAAESLAPLLTAIFAIDGRVRPFNKYLASDLRMNPLSASGWEGNRLLPRLTAILDGDVDAQHALFRDLHGLAHAAGYGAVIDEWQPNVSWLRGEADYRA